MDVAVVRSSLRIPATKLRWVDGARQQLTDALTKKNGNGELLRAVLHESRFVIVEAEEALRMKKESRDRRKERAHVRPPPGLSGGVQDRALDPPRNAEGQDRTLDLAPEPEGDSQALISSAGQDRDLEPARSCELAVFSPVVSYLDKDEFEQVDDWSKMEPEYHALLRSARSAGGLFLKIPGLKKKRR